MKEIVTSDLSKFCKRELRLLEDLLKGMREQGLPSDFSDDNVKPVMNINSGYVFLTNENFEVAMMNLGKLESFYSCPECGNEGFWDEIDHEEDNEGCREFVEMIKNNRGE